MKIPLHLSPDDLSPGANARRFDLHMAMAQMNPRGFRTPGRRSHEVSGTSSVAKAAARCGFVGAPEKSPRVIRNKINRDQHIERVKEQQRAGMESRSRRALEFRPLP